MSIEDYITKHESMVLHPYTDSVGKLTIGVGRNIDDRGISRDEALYLLKNDIEMSINDLLDIFNDFYLLPNDVQLVMIDMMFNMGETRFRGFKKMIQAVRDKDFKEAARQAKDSKWCKQVGIRCEDNYNLLYNS